MFARVLFCTVITVGMQQVHAESLAVTGVVVDSEGKTVSGAGIEMLALQGIAINRTWRSLAKRDGTFDFSDLSPGRYRLYVWKEDLGVPYDRYVIFEQVGRSHIEVDASARSAIKPVVVRLAPPYGVVSGHIVDEQTGTPIAHARINLGRVEEHGMIYSTDPASDGGFVLQLPERPIKFSVSAPGYQEWTYRDGDGGDGIVLKQGSKMTVDVKLVHK